MNLKVLTTLALWLLSLSLATPGKAQAVASDDIKQLQKQMYDMYSTHKTQEAEFMSVTNRLKELALKAGDERTFYRTWANQANFMANRMKRNRGLQMAREMQEYAAAHNHKYGIYSGTHVIGAILYMMGNIDEAQKHLLQAIEYQKQHLPHENAVASFLELAKTEYSKQHPLEAIKYTDQALKEPGIEPRHRLNALSIKCLAIADTSNYTIGAKEYIERFNQVYAEREKVKAVVGRDGIYGPRVECWKLINDKRYEEALDESDKIASPMTRLQLQQIIYKRLGNYRNAYIAQQKYMKTRDSINSFRNSHLLMEMTAAMDMGRVELEAKNLRLSNQQLQLEHIQSELEQQRLEAETAALSLENATMELANAAMKLQNDSLDRSIQVARLNEYKSKMAAQQETERTRLVIMLAVGTVLLLTIAYLIFYLHRRQQQMQKLREAYDQLEEHTTQRERMASELRIARDIQMSMVPRVFPERSDIDMYGLMSPAKAVGGDMYDYLLEDNRLYFCIGDVSGKGIPASLFMAQAARLFHALAKQHLKPHEIATQMNSDLTENNDSGMFITMFIGKVNLDNGRLYFCNAGHNPPVIDNAFIGVEPNAPIGLWPQLDYVGERMDDIRGKKIFVYTDGLNEAENTRQQQFGDDRLLAIVNKTHTLSARQTVETIREAVEQHRRGAEPNDDLTMMCLRIK